MAQSQSYQIIATASMLCYYAFMNNKEVAQILSNVSAVYAIKDQKKYYFQMLAYQKAAEAIEGMSTQVEDLYKEGKLENIEGVGPSIRAHLTELFKTGRVKH